MNTVISVILSVLSVIITTKMLSVVWHTTLIRLIVVRTVCRFSKFEFPKDISSVSEFEMWCVSRLPFPEYKIGAWMVCPLCTAPYFAAMCLLPGLFNLGVTDHLYDARMAITVIVFTFVMSTAFAMTTRRSTSYGAPNVESTIPVAAVTTAQMSTRLKTYVGLTVTQRQSVKTAAHQRWNTALGFIQTTNDAGARVISTSNSGIIASSEAMKFFYDADVSYLGAEATQLQVSYKNDLAIFKASGECSSCAPEAHVQHLYYDDVIAILKK